jgi:tetratricopeptide (TPR) repeat protein
MKSPHSKSGTPSASTQFGVPPDRILPFQKFLRHFRDAHHYAGRKEPFCFILGAGASVQSGIHAAEIMVDEWLRDMYADAQSGEALEAWATAKNLGIPGFDYARRAESYSAIYDRRWEGQEGDGILYLQEKMKGILPSYGYAVLAQLVSDHHRVIITTNFDSLATDALFQFGGEAPFICGHEHLVDYIPEHSTRPVVIKLHHDLLTGPLSSRMGTSRLNKAWRNPMTRLLQRFIPIFIGYGGNDGSLMTFLDGLPKGTPSCFYWCQYKGGTVNATVADYIVKRGGFLVIMDGFDQLMAEIHRTLGLPDLVKTLEEVNQRRLAHLRASQQKLTETAKADVAKAEAAEGADSPAALAARFAFANALFDQGRYADAEAEHHAILGLRRDKLGPEHSDTLASWHQWARCLLRLGRTKTAEAEYGKLASIRARVLGAEHPDTLHSHNNFAEALRLQGENAGAEVEHRAVLAVRERVLGAEHPDTLTSRNNLAISLDAQGKHADALAEHRAVLAIRKRVLNPEHPDIVQSRNNLAVALEAQGQHAEAEAETRAVLAIRERALSAEHPDIAQSCYNLALCLKDQKKPTDALPFARRASAIWEKALGKEHPNTKNSQALVAHLESALKGGGK